MQRVIKCEEFKVQHFTFKISFVFNMMSSFKNDLVWFTNYCEYQHDSFSFLIDFFVLKK